MRRWPRAQIGGRDARRKRDRPDAEDERPRDGPQQARSRKQREHSPVEQTVAQRDGSLRPPPDARALDQAVVADTAWTGGYAGQASETTVEMAGHARVERQLAVL